MEKLNNKVLSAGDPLLPDPMRSSGAFIVPQGSLHLQGAMSVPTASLLLTEVCRVQELGCLESEWQLCHHLTPNNF